MVSLLLRQQKLSDTIVCYGSSAAQLPSNLLNVTPTHSHNIYSETNQIFLPAGCSTRAPAQRDCTSQTTTKLYFTGCCISGELFSALANQLAQIVCWSPCLYRSILWSSRPPQYGRQLLAARVPVNQSLTMSLSWQVSRGRDSIVVHHTVQPGLGESRLEAMTCKTLCNNFKLLQHSLYHCLVRQLVPLDCHSKSIHKILHCSLASHCFPHRT